MTEFAERLSEEQRRAAVAYAIAHRSAPAAIRAAAAGQLPGFPEPFTISKSYLSELVREEKERSLEGSAPRGATAAEMADTILRRELKRMDTASRANRLNPQKAREMLRVCKDLDVLARKAPAPPSGDDQDQEPDAPEQQEQPMGIVERLAAEIAAQEAAARKAGQHDAGTKTGDSGEHDGRVGSHTRAGGGGGGVR